MCVCVCYFIALLTYLQCYDCMRVGAGEREMSTLPVLHWDYGILFVNDYSVYLSAWGSGMVICLGEVQICIWPTNATVTHCLLLQ